MTETFVIRGNELKRPELRRFLESLLLRAKALLVDPRFSSSSTATFAVIADCLAAKHGLADQLPDLADALHNLATHLESGSVDLAAADALSVTRQTLRL